MFIPGNDGLPRRTVNKLGFIEHRVVNWAFVLVLDGRFDRARYWHNHSKGSDAVTRADKACRPNSGECCAWDFFVACHATKGTSAVVMKDLE
jgi:hypothetical protein